MVHRIHSVLPEGPVGKTNRVFPGDYLIEVNGILVLELTHLEVVTLIQSLPEHIRLIVARLNEGYSLYLSTFQFIYLSLKSSENHCLFATKKLL